MERIIDQVYGILSKAGIAFETRPDGKQYRVRNGSAYVFVGFLDRGEDALVALTCPILQEIDESVPGTLKLFEAVNHFNCQTLFGKACWYPESRTITVEHYLRGNDLQAAELLHALELMAETVEAEDDVLLETLRTGHKGDQVWAVSRDDDDDIIDA
jgi:hypothetical protein